MTSRLRERCAFTPPYPQGSKRVIVNAAMKIVLISANSERVNMPTMPLGLGLVAAATRRAGHEVRFLDLMFQNDPVAAVEAELRTHAPDLIGVSIRNIDDQNQQHPRFLLERVRPVIQACRATSKAPIVLGGAGFSMFPAQVLAFLGADYGVRGGGEVALVALLDCLQRGEDPSAIPGLLVAGRSQSIAPTFSEDLDALPMPDENLWSQLDPTMPELWVPIEARRGCPNRCSYCATAQIQGTSIRCREPQSVVDSMARMAAAGFKRFYVVDNSFNLPESYALAFCRTLERAALGISWRCILYPHRVTEELVSAMAAAGCVEVAVGFESGSERILKNLNKHFTPDEVRRSVELLGAHGIRKMGFLLLGGPGETRETVEESLAFARSNPLDALKITAGIRIYPHTALAAIALAEGLITPDDDLLQPRFYMAPGLEPWIHERLARASNHGD